MKIVKGMFLVFLGIVVSGILISSISLISRAESDDVPIEENETHLYSHNLTISGICDEFGEDGYVYIYLTILADNDTPITYESLWDLLDSNGKGSISTTGNIAYHENISIIYVNIRNLEDKCVNFGVSDDDQYSIYNAHVVDSLIYQIF